MDKEKLTTIFAECFTPLSTKEQIEVHNLYCMECAPDDGIFENDEEFFETFFNGNAYEVVRATQCGHYHYADDYVWFNGYGNLDSSFYDLPIKEPTEMVDFFIENPIELEYIDGMQDFLDAVDEYEDEI